MKLPKVQVHGKLVYAQIGGRKYNTVELRPTKEAAATVVENYKKRGYDAKLAENKWEGAKFAIVVPGEQLNRAISNEMNKPPTIKLQPRVELRKPIDVEVVQGKKDLRLIKLQAKKQGNVLDITPSGKLGRSPVYTVKTFKPTPMSDRVYSKKVRGGTLLSRRPFKR